MNNLSKLMVGLAAFSLAACSSDEPTPSTPDVNDGTTMYLNINITDANSSRSRAEGDYIFGDAVEHEVNNADFFFYDAQGNFVTRANVWSPSDETQAPNIEYMGKNTLVLRNLTKNNLPQWVITVLNAPSTFVEKVQNSNLTLNQTRAELMEIMTGNYFCMSTTSFFDATKDADRYDNEHYGATGLKTGDFMTEPVTTIDPDKVVNIYVERLAAKFTLTGLDKDGIFPVDVTIAGKDNNDDDNVEGDIPSGSEKVYVRILGYGLTGQEKASYLTKNIAGFETTAPWTETTPGAPAWNHPDYFRSYWAKSPNYGDATPDLQYTTFAKAKNPVDKAIYGYETTNTLEAIKNGDNLIANNVTSMLFTARVYATKELAEAGGEDTGLDLVEFNGVYFTKDQYIKYALNRLLNAGGLKYFINEQIKTEETAEGTKTIYTYDPLTADNFTVTFVQPEGAETGEFQITYTGTEQLYVKPANYTEGAFTKVDNKALNAELAAFNSSSKAYAFTGGAMYYSVPIEHLLGKNSKPVYKPTLLGEYGVVRNHWYQINVGKVFRLGHGVFNPDGDNGEELKPGDDTETFALAAKINILSWKIVQQDVDL